MFECEIKNVRRLKEDEHDLICSCGEAAIRIAIVGDVEKYRSGCDYPVCDTDYCLDQTLDYFLEAHGYERTGS